MATTTAAAALLASDTERPASIEDRREFGHWEADTVMGTGTRDCILSLVERKTGIVIIGKLSSRTSASVNARAIELIRANRAAFKTITADNGTEFHNYSEIETRTQARFYFATPYHSWERGTNENTNGLIRQYFPKGSSMVKLTQQRCEQIAHHLNTRPRKRHGYKTPPECLNEA